MKVSFGGGVADGRGSIGGTTFSRNRYGSYARKRVTPVNPNSPWQIIARDNFRSATTAWRSLTDTNRTAWTQFANNTPVLDKLGNTIYLTGPQMYMSVTGPLRTYNAYNAVQLSIPAQPNATGGVQPWDITSVTVDASIASGLEITVAGGGVAGTTPGQYAMIYWGKCVGATTNYYKGPWLSFGQCFFSGATPTVSITFPTAIFASFGITPILGGRMSFKLVRFSTLSNLKPSESITSFVWDA
jgi:hypothetical protein